MKKIFITGSNGFIGRNLKEYFSDKYILLAPTHIELDLCNTEQTEKFLRESKVDVVIHSANTNNTRKKNIADYEVINNNLRMFYNLKRCRKYYAKMYYFGSGAEYDSLHYVPLMKEEYFGQYIPKDAYGFSKYIMANSINDVDNIVDLRLFGVYGKYEEWERRFISNNICRVLNGLPISINQNIYFDYLSIDDLARILEWFIENNPIYKHYNVCTGTSIDLLTIANIIKKEMATESRIIVHKEGFKTEYSGSNCRLLNELSGFEFTNLDIAIRKLIEFYTKSENIVNDARRL